MGVGFLQSMFRKGAIGAFGSGRKSYSAMNEAGASDMTANIYHNLLAATKVHAGGAMRWASRSPERAYGMAGAGIGGAYGAVSDDTSVFEGAMAGAMLGAGGSGALRAGRWAGGAYSQWRGVGCSRWVAAEAVGRESYGHIANSMTKKYKNVRSTLKKSADKLDDWWSD